VIIGYCWLYDALRPKSRAFPQYLGTAQNFFFFFALTTVMMDSFSRRFEITYICTNEDFDQYEGFASAKSSHSDVEVIAGNRSITLKVRLLPRCRTHLMTANNPVIALLALRGPPS
jgi:hypothetical protein